MPILVLEDHVDALAQAFFVDMGTALVATWAFDSDGRSFAPAPRQNVKVLLVTGRRFAVVANLFKGVDCAAHKVISPLHGFPPRHMATSVVA